MFKKLFASGLVFFFSLGLFKYADAHVTINPKVVEPGSYEKVDVRVPVEQKDHTEKVELDIPKEVQVSNIQPVEGYKYSLDKDKKGNITKITWKAKDKGIGPNEFIEFPLLVASPKEEGTGKANSEHPAPTLEVEKNANAVTVKEDNAKKDEKSHSSSGGSIALWIISLVAIILSLVALFKHARNK